MVWKIVGGVLLAAVLLVVAAGVYFSRVANPRVVAELKADPDGETMGVGNIVGQLDWLPARDLSADEKSTAVRIKRQLQLVTQRLLLIVEHDEVAQGARDSHLPTQNDA